MTKIYLRAVQASGSDVYKKNIRLMGSLDGKDWTTEESRSFIFMGRKNKHRPQGGLRQSWEEVAQWVEEIAGKFVGEGVFSFGEFIKFSEVEVQWDFYGKYADFMANNATPADFDGVRKGVSSFHRG